MGKTVRPLSKLETKSILPSLLTKQLLPLFVILRITGRCPLEYNTFGNYTDYSFSRKCLKSLWTPLVSAIASLFIMAIGLLQFGALGVSVLSNRRNSLMEMQPGSGHHEISPSRVNPWVAVFRRNRVHFAHRDGILHLVVDNASTRKIYVLSWIFPFMSYCINSTGLISTGAYVLDDIKVVLLLKCVEGCFSEIRKQIQSTSFSDKVQLRNLQGLLVMVRSRAESCGRYLTISQILSILSQFITRPQPSTFALRSSWSPKYFVVLGQMSFFQFVVTLPGCNKIWAATDVTEEDKKIAKIIKDKELLMVEDDLNRELQSIYTLLDTCPTEISLNNYVTLNNSLILGVQLAKTVAVLSQDVPCPDMKIGIQSDWRFREPLQNVSYCHTHWRDFDFAVGIVFLHSIATHLPASKIFEMALEIDPFLEKTVKEFSNNELRYKKIRGTLLKGFTQAYAAQLKANLGVTLISNEDILVKSHDSSRMDFFELGYLKQRLFKRREPLSPGKQIERLQRLEKWKSHKVISFLSAGSFGFVFKIAKARRLRQP
ncbi:hypothetical protein Fcan01_28667, partial [Folsomia candida]